MFIVKQTLIPPQRLPRLSLRDPPFQFLEEELLSGVTESLFTESGKQNNTIRLQGADFPGPSEYQTDPDIDEGGEVHTLERDGSYGISWRGSWVDAHLTNKEQNLALGSRVRTYWNSSETWKCELHLETMTIEEIWYDDEEDDLKIEGRCIFRYKVQAAIQNVFVKPVWFES
ncbi:hypothetical protein M422DRAFT_49679 [Sphaerobolus stellatus SS14]|uniref:Uncharacterized protein n=1 Tax=Sphaerobolus stellatus (strain SS14) TaxID=990650 RepID=A0A0C9VNF5_SPHS4|nr:hypothetical protein M422DRAFT_274906 [Sphaerobolus stellatus SS14]KIJ39276.1 hypothetical protein M422DRAFT_49679 [Sphaerobolus stellatus SS14]